MKKTTLTALTAAGMIIVGTAQGADPFEPPRGRDVSYIASRCSIGPFPQVSKAGPYNVLCKTMPDSEKCLALVKSQIRNDGTIDADTLDKERNEFCLNLLTKELLGTL